MDCQKHAIKGHTCHQNERKVLYYLVFLGSWSQELSSSLLIFILFFFLLFLCFRPHIRHFSPMIRRRQSFSHSLFFSSSFLSSKCGGSGRPRRDVVVVSCHHRRRHLLPFSSFCSSKETKQTLIIFILFMLWIQYYIFVVGKETENTTGQRHPQYCIIVKERKG